MISDLTSYAGSSTATGTVSQARQAKRVSPHKDRHPGPPGLGLDIGLTTQSQENKSVVKTI